MEYRYKPYENDKDEAKIWFVVAAMMTIVPLVAEEAQLWWAVAAWAICTVLFWKVAFLSRKEKVAEVILSDEGIRIVSGKRDALSFQNWERFGCAYLLDLTWTDTDHLGFKKQRYGAYYLVLAEKALPESELSKLAGRLSGRKPCGKIGDYTAVQSTEEANSHIHACIGGKIPLIERNINAEGKTVRL